MNMGCDSCHHVFCETRPPLFSPSWLIQWNMGEVSYITLFSPSDVAAFHRIVELWPTRSAETNVSVNTSHLRSAISRCHWYICLTRYWPGPMSTNPKPKIYRILYENTGPAHLNFRPVYGDRMTSAAYPHMSALPLSGHSDCYITPQKERMLANHRSVIPEIVVQCVCPHTTGDMLVTRDWSKCEMYLCGEFWLIFHAWSRFHTTHIVSWHVRGTYWFCVFTTVWTNILKHIKTPRDSCWSLYQYSRWRPWWPPKC